MKYRCLVLAAVIAFPTWVVAGEESAQERSALIDEYFTYVSMNKLMGDMAEEVSKQVPADQRQMFIDTMTKHLRLEVIEDAAKESLARHLTVPELKMFVEFIKHPEARSAMDKMKYYMADLMPVIQREMAAAIQRTAASSHPE